MLWFTTNLNLWIVLTLISPELEILTIFLLIWLPSTGSLWPSEFVLHFGNLLLRQRSALPHLILLYFTCFYMFYILHVWSIVCTTLKHISLYVSDILISYVSTSEKILLRDSNFLNIPKPYMCITFFANSSLTYVVYLYWCSVISK